MIRAIIITSLSFVLSACGAVDTATRNASAGGSAASVAQLDYDVQSIRVTVPETLSVSEANRYLPKADIVWREDPPGDRYAQVKMIFEAAMAQGVGSIPTGTVPVVLDVQVAKFHALSEKARYSVGGVHELEFFIVLRNPETGTAYNEPHSVRASFKAYGGQAAIDAEAKGITQKHRITNHLATVIATELTNREGHVAPRLGLLGALNRI